MAKDAILQARVDSSDKIKAAAIMEGLGLDLSAAVNMLLKQIIIQKGLPFLVMQEYESKTEKYVSATMALEGMPLTQEDRSNIRSLINGSASGDEIRERTKAGI